MPAATHGPTPLLRRERGAESGTDAAAGPVKTRTEIAFGASTPMVMTFSTPHEYDDTQLRLLAEAGCKVVLLGPNRKRS